MAILDRATAQNLFNYTLDSTVYGDSYLTAAISAVEKDVERYLHWNPVLQTHLNETGVATFIPGGTYAGRYMVELRHQPLVSSDATQVFTLFQLTYPLSLPISTDVNLTFVKTVPDTGQVFALAPGTVEALAAAYFGWVPISQNVTAVGYKVSYSSGYATSISDPVNPITNQAFTGVQTIPAQIQYAAALLLRERLVYDNASNKNWDNPMAGLLFRRRVGEREEAYRPFTRNTVQGTLGFGTPLAESAEMLLKPYQKRRLPLFL